MQKTVTVFSLESLSGNLKKLNKKLARRKLPAITIVSTEAKIKQISMGENAFLEPVVISLPYFEAILELPIENMGFADTRVLGYVEVTGIGDLILHPMSENAAERMESLRESAIRCDHCQLARRRKTTFIFDRSGTISMVGKQCAKEHFGFDGHDDEFFASGRFSFDRQMFLASSLFYIRKEGFRPASQGPQATANAAFSLTESMRKGDTKHVDYADFHAVGARLIEQLNDIFDWFEQANKDSFLLNCRAALRDPNYLRMPLLAAAVNAYFKAVFSELDAARRAAWTQENADKEAAKAFSTHYGVAGQRVDVSATYAAIIPLEPNEFGERALLKFVTENGSELAWFTGSDPLQYEIGQRYMVRGTVKKHSEYKGVKQTTMGRCKLTPIAVAA
jgi:hypothetical protein